MHNKSKNEESIFYIKDEVASLPNNYGFDCISGINLSEDGTFFMHGIDGDDQGAILWTNDQFATIKSMQCDIIDDVYGSPDATNLYIRGNGVHP